MKGILFSLKNNKINFRITSAVIVISALRESNDEASAQTMHVQADISLRCPHVTTDRSYAVHLI